MLSLWYFFLRKRAFTWLMMVALIAAGAVSVLVIPKESSPEVIVPVGIVTTVYPGASALDVEELITVKLEQEIANLDRIDSIQSTSREGASLITATFDASADIDKSIRELKDAVERVRPRLPRDAEDPTVSEVNFADQPIVVLSISAELPPVAFTELAESIAEEFESVSGVSRVVVTGVREREVQIVVREADLRRYNLSLNDVTNALASANLTLPVGTIGMGGVEYSVRYEGKIDAVTEIANIAISTVGGVPVLVRDVALVRDAVARESTISRVSVGGVPAENAFTLSIFKRSGFDVTKLSELVREKLDTLTRENGALAAAQVLVVFDQGESAKKDLTDLTRTGMETVILVMVTLFLTIGWRESLVAGLSIPLSFTIAFIGLYASGNTINFISLFSLILAIGILVDSGIVITEAIHTRLRKYGNATDAAHAALKEYAWPLIGGTMTTIAVFAPLFFLSGVTGEFIASIPFTIIFVLLASILVALGFVPLLAIIFTNRHEPNRLEKMQEEYTVRIQEWYRAKLKRLLLSTRAQRWFMRSFVIAFIVVLSFPFTGFLKVVFFPGGDADYVFIEVETKQGTPLAETDLVVRTIEEVLYEKPYVESFTSTVGAGSSFTGSSDSGGKFGNLTVTLVPERAERSEDIVADLRGEFLAITNADVSITELQEGPPSGSPIAIKFFGEDLGALALVVERAETILRSIPGTRDIVPSTKSSATELVLSVDTDRAATLGVTPAAIGQVLRSAVFGTTATTFRKDGKDIDVVVKLALQESVTDASQIPEVTLDALRNLTVPSRTGTPVLLGSVLTESIAPANAAIVREDEERVESISAYTETGVTPAEVVAAFRAREAELELPAGVRISYGGETEDINRSFAEMGAAFVAGLLLMLAMLVLSFNSLRYSLYLLLVVPLSLIGVFTGLAIAGLALSFTSLLGLIALSGVIINHGILLVDSMLRLRAGVTTVEGVLDAVAEAAVSRLRPIILTTITTVVGMIPLSLVSDLWSPLAFAIMFGLLFATVLTLMLIPILIFRHEKRLFEATHSS